MRLLTWKFVWQRALGKKSENKDKSLPHCFHSPVNLFSAISPLKFSEIFSTSLYIYHCSTVVDFSSEKYSGSTGHRNSWYQRRNFQSGCRWWDPNSQPLGYKPSALAIELTSSQAIAGKELSLSSWCIASFYIYHCSTVVDFSSEKYSGVASSSLTIGILTENFSAGTRSSCVQWNHCTFRMRSQPQLSNDKYTMMQYTSWINSTPSQQ